MTNPSAERSSPGVLGPGTLPETNGKFAPENRPKPNRKGSYSNHPFLGAMLVSGRVMAWDLGFVPTLKLWPPFFSK